MSLSPDLQDIFGSYEFCDEERRQLIDLLEESNKQYEKELASDEVNWAKSNDLLEALSNDAKDFFNEFCEYTIAWKYSTQDLIDANNEIVKLVKGD